MTVKEIGRMFHRDISWVSHRLRLLKVPEPWRSQLISGELVESKALFLVGKDKDKEFYEAVRLDQEQHPDRWRTREQWEFQINKIMASIKRGRASVDAKQPRGQTPGQACEVPLPPFQSQPINKAATSNKAGNNAKPSVRSVHGQTDTTASSSEPPNIGDSIPSVSRMLTDDQVRDMVQPYAKSRADLVAIRNHCRYCLEELAANRPSQRKYAGRTKRVPARASA